MCVFVCVCQRFNLGTKGLCMIEFCRGTGDVFGTGDLQVIPHFFVSTVIFQSSNLNLVQYKIKVFFNKTPEMDSNILFQVVGSTLRCDF